VLNKFKQRKEANKRHKPMLLFRVTRNIWDSFSGGPYNWF
jgi:hypothetical protein